MTIQAANGAVTLAERPAAIVSLSPTITEMLYAIGAGDQVVAADRQSTYPPGVPNATIDALQLNVEAVAGFHPDLVISSYLTEAQAAKFAALDITVLSEPAAATLEDTYREIRELGTVTGHAAEATSLVDRMKAQIDQIRLRAPHFDTPPTYYYELDQTYYTVTSDTFVGRILALAGLTNIADGAQGAAAAGGYPQLDAEYILHANPDYIFLADSGCCGQSPETVAARPGWQVLDAVRGGRVITLDDDIASRWGPRVVDLLRAVVDGLQKHPLPQ